MSWLARCACSWKLKFPKIEENPKIVPVCTLIHSHFLFFVEHLRSLRCYTLKLRWRELLIKRLYFVITLFEIVCSVQISLQTINIFIIYPNFIWGTQQNKIQWGVTLNLKCSKVEGLHLKIGPWTLVTHFPLFQRNVFIQCEKSFRFSSENLPFRS